RKAGRIASPSANVTGPRMCRVIVDHLGTPRGEHGSEPSRRPCACLGRTPPAPRGWPGLTTVPYELTVALRYLTAKRRQAFISLISAISVIGVAVGVMAVLISLGLMTGLQGEIRSRILGATAHLTIYRNGGAPFEEYRDVVQNVREVPGVL